MNLIMNRHDVSHMHVRVLLYIISFEKVLLYAEQIDFDVFSIVICNSLRVRLCTYTSIL